MGECGGGHQRHECRKQEREVLDPPEVDQVVRPRGQLQVGLSVRDDGIGFDPGQAEELFGVFMRAAPAGPDTPEGLGLGLAVWFVHSQLAERALVPYVVASQTVPILAISPIVVNATKAGWLSVALVTAYLTFFPVTIGALRGLRAADPRAFELFRSYAASRRQILMRLRMPASLPYLFAALRIAARISAAVPLFAIYARR